MDGYEQRKQRLIRQLKQAKGSVGLQKSTSNLFRRREASTKRINVRDFNHVLHIDAKGRVADVEGMTTFEEFADATLKFGLLPAVVPQLKTITIGGAATGLGIESSSFLYGLVHESVLEMEVLLGDGRVVVCSRTKNKDLFYGFPNSYGTLGYALRLKVKLIPAKRYVKLNHKRFTDSVKYFAELARICKEKKFDYVDGTIFNEREMYITTGTFVDQAPFTSDYTYLRIFYKSIRKKSVDYLTAHDYIWRWDTDWFWCSKNVYAQNPVVRILATKKLLNSRTYQKLMRLSHRILPASKRTESVIQDVDIPIQNAPAFLKFFLKEIGITPVWVCPFIATTNFDLYLLDPKKLYINFGFWDVVSTAHPPGHYNKLVERKVQELGGKKSLYSTSYYDEKSFWSIYNKPRYDALKKKYDPKRRLKNLYEKVVLRK
jgi:FAD/FMN-containing dehydrogenase